MLGKGKLNLSKADSNDGLKQERESGMIAHYYLVKGLVYVYRS